MKELKRYHKLYDIYNSYEGINNLKTINDNAGITPVVVDKEIIDLLKFSINLYDKTEGQILLLLVPSSPVLVLRIKKKKIHL